MKPFFCVLSLCFVLFSAPLLHAGEVDEIGEIEINTRILDGDDEIQILAVPDPDNPFITCYLTSIHAGKILDTAAPSDNCLECAITGAIPKNADGSFQLVTKKDLNVFKLRKSIGFKKIRIARHWDKKRKVFVYTAYSKKIMEGSFKHSMSIVPVR